MTTNSTQADNSVAGKPQQKRGSKLNRSKIINSRVSPDLYQAAEALARHHRRTMSSFIEMLIAAEVQRQIT